MKDPTVKKWTRIGRPPTKAARRLAAATLAVALAASIAIGVSSTASAAPTAPAAVHEVSQLDDITYSAAFTLGVQVYERIATFPRKGGVDAMVLRRVPSPTGGDPSLPKYALLGSPLPTQFTSYNMSRESDVLGEIGYSIDPHTGKQKSTPPPPLSLNLVVGRIGPFVGAAVVWPALPA